MASGSSSQPIKNIVLVGRAGNGKSATGNSLVRKQIFISSGHATGVTKTCKSFRAVTPDGAIINVIDTPGTFDLMTNPALTSMEIVRCLALAEEGLHAVVLVLSVRTRITKEEEDSLCMLQQLFGANILDYLIVVFTGGDELAKNNKTLETHLSPCPKYLMNIFTLCGHRKVLFDNKTENEDQKNKQIQQLLEHVVAIGRKNNGRLFTAPVLLEIHGQIRGEIVRFRRAESEAEAKYKEPELESKKKKLKDEHEHNMSKLEKMVLNIIMGGFQVLATSMMMPCNIL